ncbi:NAD(P)H-hydrate dehydratase [Liquorilactobacillus oeni]|uniref:ADP-dependent (S)-NAD(P)H-hydrate dehydratase n=1 Tax=Liquorilactobacillus oeni DSM 19972 TaxID=1423777 RepID=A0A0R1MA18_9LACO|nr:NAD(P)H-hydrate dehydratase [Liquorilactobacillus oeni]KRL04940.1 carbohydrate kinase [Liquorilactobacillus oeni DSM 19972]
MLQLDEKILNQIIKPRPLESHKGNFGKILTVGGNQQYGGAIILSTAAAIHAGAGLVSCATSPQNLTALHSIVPEAMFIDFNNKKAVSQAAEKTNVIVVGPGLGIDIPAVNILENILRNSRKNQFLIIDGSAISLLADNQKLFKFLKEKQVIFTPHQMEWQRISGIKIADQAEDTNKKQQQKLHATVVLKKYHTVIYHLDGTSSLLPIGGPYMSTGGMGDTLTGIIAAFLGQFHLKDYEQVIDAAVYCHSAIAAELSSSHYIVLPTDIIGRLQEFMAQYTNS